MNLLTGPSYFQILELHEGKVAQKLYEYILWACKLFILENH